MDAKESLRILLEALHELKKQHITRQMLIDLVRGNETRELTERGLEKLESFGCDDKHEELHFNMVIDQALEEKLLKEVDDGLISTTKGERFRKAPTSFILKDEEEEEEPKDNALLESLVQETLHDKDDEEDIIPIPAPHTSGRSQHMIQLIQAIDRKLPLDDYAEQNKLDFDDVLDDLEHLVKQGVKLDISYFTDEVLGKECIQELHEYFDEVDGNLNKTIDEFDGIYQPEEIRLARLVW